MKAWLKTLIGGACLLTILLDLVPEGKFVKYVRFYAGLLFFLMAAAPVLQLLGGEDELERLLQLEFLKEEYYDLETAVEGMSDLKSDRIRAAYQQELFRQVEELVQACGINGARTEVSFGGGEGYELTGVQIWIPGGPYADERVLAEAAEALRGELLSVYGLAMNRVSIVLEGGTQL